MTAWAYLLGYGFFWMVLTDALSMTGFLVGLLFGAVILCVEGVRPERPPSMRRALRLLRATLKVLLLFAWEVAVANFQQLRIVFRPRIAVRPHWLRYPTRLENPKLQALLGVLISMTPGTVTCDIDPKSRILWIHILDAAHVGDVASRIASRLEGPLAELEAR